MFRCQKQPNFFQFTESLIKETNFENVQAILCCVLLLGGTKHGAVLESVDQRFELLFGLWSDKYERLLGGYDDDHFAVERIEVFIVEDGGS